MTLTPLKEMYSEWHRIEYDSVEYEPVPPELEAQEPEKEEGENERSFAIRLRSWRTKTRVVVQPEPGDFKLPDVPPPEMMVDLRRDHRETGLQVIVKLANIELTPEQPEYDGGPWHVEGHMVRRILHLDSMTKATCNRLPTNIQLQERTHLCHRPLLL